MNSPSAETTTLFFFGPPGKQLFGLYHPPAAGLERDFGVLICNPWGQEYMRAHRALSQLGQRLARQGFPVLRFDYFGTGDSAGADGEGSLTQWQADVRLAIQELKRRARVESVFLAGLRLGASLAALVAGGRDDVEGLVMWEPAVSGADYIRDLVEWHTEKQRYFLNQGAPLDDHAELLGFELHPTLLADLEGLDLLAMKRKPAGRVLIIESNPNPQVAHLREHYQSLGARAEYQCIESFKMWAEDPDKGLVPHAILEAAVNWLAREAL